jgi:NAD(P)-dependent dehydrogenase (short-subunit alcohol dehydrogenase family)
MSTDASRPLAGQRVLVTGAALGIGSGVAIACAQAGADLALHYFNEESEMEATATAIRACGRKAVVLKGDFRRTEDIQSVAEGAEAALGGIDILVNNAGHTATCPFDEVTPALFDAMFGVNIRAMFFLTQHLSRGMAKRRHGVVINIASLHAFLGRAGHSVYAASKGAVVSLTSQLAVELAAHGIRVNAIAPGTCISDNHRGTSSDAEIAAAGTKLPAGYFSVPEQLGDLVVFLASAQGRYFVGQTLRFDGGYSVLFPLVGDFRQQPPPTGQRYL